jgi:integrase
MKDETIFEDPKSNKPWASADAIRKKHGFQYCVRQVFVTKSVSDQTYIRHQSYQQGVNLFWLAGQMGHKGPEMLFRHYGTYLKNTMDKQLARR